MGNFVPYQNESDVLRVGGLTIENRVDRVTITGDIDLTADQAGLADARALHQLLAAVVAHLEAQSLPDHLPPPVATIVNNPFE
ncbi:hypothetical protein FHW58_001297 [Duganella sp. 1224]|uniref:hypothetical protein n=1 Tax=Duganella sp. 1224 TaxID=2587052 RepID=UPI0015CB44C6|nr:hypothetical protein [Duganella sp. 1224]NYE60145.1 hypothetical protein [Duganella sp. 1224]